MSFKKALFGLAALALAGTGHAQGEIFINDTFTSFAPTFTKYKNKKGVVQMQTLCISGYLTTNLDYKSVKKLKANISLAFYLSTDEFHSEDDTLVGTAEVTNCKMMRAKKTKFTTPVTEANKGQFLVVKLESPQDEWDVNNWSFVEIRQDAF